MDSYGLNSHTMAGFIDTACREWRNMPPADTVHHGRYSKHILRLPTRTSVFFSSTTGSSDYHGAAPHMTTNADTSLFAVMQARLVAAEDALAVALTYHNISPTTSIANAASNVSVTLPTTSSTSASSARSYCWTQHGTTLNLHYTNSTCRDKRQGHHDEAIKENKLDGSNNVCGRPHV
jgi:hypothetical protein